MGIVIPCAIATLPLASLPQPQPSSQCMLAMLLSRGIPELLFPTYQPWSAQGGSIGQR